MAKDFQVVLTQTKLWHGRNDKEISETLLANRVSLKKATKLVNLVDSLNTTSFCFLEGEQFEQRNELSIRRVEGNFELIENHIPIVWEKKE